MNDQALKQFDFRGASVRTVMIKGEPWRVAADVWAVLEIENTKQAVARLEKDDVCQTYTLRSNGRPYQMTVVSEPGLYKLIIRSPTVLKLKGPLNPLNF
jgi:anti-repressor protein